MFDDRTVWDHLDAARRFGYRCVELRSTHVKPGLPKEELERIRSTIEESGLYTSCLSCFVGNYGLCSDEECGQAFETFKQYAELASLLNSEMIRIRLAGKGVRSRIPTMISKSASFFAARSSPPRGSVNTRMSARPAS
jgi:sugar phosphate isomerase/epimerase